MTEAPTISESTLEPFTTILLNNAIEFIPIGIGLLVIGFGFSLFWSYLRVGIRMVGNFGEVAPDPNGVAPFPNMQNKTKKRRSDLGKTHDMGFNNWLKGGSKPRNVKHYKDGSWSATY